VVPPVRQGFTAERTERAAVPVNIIRNDTLTEQVMGAAIEVHRQLGPRQLESTYEACLCFELAQRAIDCSRQVPLPVIYKGNRLDCGYRIDVLVEQALIVEVKSVDKLIRIHEAQLPTYLRLAGLRTGLLLNFNAVLLKHGLHRYALSPSPCSARSAVNST
jgi:GxxExxY protein